MTDPLHPVNEPGEVLYHFSDYDGDSISVVLAPMGLGVSVCTAGAVMLGRAELLDITEVLQTVLEGPEAGMHLVLFDDQGWTIQHAAGCRRHGLLTCPYTSAANTFDGSHPYGRFEVGLDDHGQIIVKDAR